MTKIVIRLLTAIIGCLISFSACESLTDSCKKTRWEAIEDPIITVRVNCNITSFGYNLATYKISDASEVSYTGTITKIYCNGNKSGSFDFKRTIYPVGGKLVYDNVMAGGPYQFNFQNDFDKLEVMVRMRIAFPDGSVFRPRYTETYSYYYKDIKFDINNLEKYILYRIEAPVVFDPVK